MHPSLVLAVFLVLPAGPPANGDGGKADALQPDPTWKELGRSLWFDPKAKRVILRARVVLREGVLEHLICLKGTKEHEAILATDAVANQIHAALLATGEPGHAVRFLPSSSHRPARRLGSNSPGAEMGRSDSRMLDNGSGMKKPRHPWRSTGSSPAVTFTKTLSPRKPITPPMRAT